MTEATPNLVLPAIAAAQAQKHVTHNEALRALDALVHLSVQDRDLASPPDEPEDGARWLVAADAEGEWTGHDQEIAAWQNVGWLFYAPRAGWLCHVADENVLLVHDGADWREAGASIKVLNELVRLGVGTEADGDNPFAAKLNKVLWTALYDGEGGDGSLRYTLNKEAPGHVLSLLMQSDWSGRAEVGLIGSDDLSVKVSADGEVWKEALVVDRTSGLVGLTQGIVHPPTGLQVPLYIPSPAREIWRLGASRGSSPRAYTIDGASGTTLSLTSADADKIFSAYMRNNAAVRVWNLSKAPVESAWVDWDLSSTELRVTDASHIAGWINGETLQLGDPNPTEANVLRMIALDISSYLANELGAVFPQKGIFVGLAVTSSDGSVDLALSPNGATGSAFGGRSLSDGGFNTMTMPLPTSVPSPISSSNLVFVRESVIAPASDMTLTMVRMLGLYI